MPNAGWIALSCFAAALLLKMFGLAAAQAPAVTLEPVAGGAWRVSYALDAPVRALETVRTPGDSRTARWRPVDARFEIVHLPGRDARDVIRRKDGTPFDRVAFDTPGTYASFSKGYAPFAPFTDGGLLIHSGRFHVCPEGAACDVWTMTITPPEGAGVLTPDGWAEGTVRFNSRGGGPFLYVGRRRPIETEHVWALVDPGFPRDANDKLETLLPVLMAHYAARLPAPETKPTLFASLDLADVDGRIHSQGGVLPGQIAMHLQGPAWAQERDFSWLPWFYAHEAAHLHQARLNIRREDSWFHEGAAEAFAHEALKALDAAPPSYLGARRRAAFHACAQFLAENALKRAARADAFQSYYDCGLHMWFAAAAAVTRAGNGDVIDLWLAIEGRARNRTDGSFDIDVFFETVAELGDQATADFLRALVEEAHPEDSAVFLREGLVAAGVDHVMVETPPAQ